jgi:hypothetical protein
MADRIKKPDESGRAPQKPDLTPDKFQKPEIDRLLQIFFTQSVVGISFMTLDEPVDWRHAADPEKLLDEIFYQEQVTNFNQAYLTMFAMEAEGFLHKTPADFYAYDIKSGKEDWKALLNTGRQHINPSEQRPGSWIEGEIIALEDNSGRLLGHVTAIWEITYKKDMEAGQERMLNKISEFRYLQKKDGPASLPFVSEAFKDIFDLSQEDVIDDARAMSTGFSLPT